MKHRQSRSLDSLTSVNKDNKGNGNGNRNGNGNGNININNGSKSNGSAEFHTPRHSSSTLFNNLKMNDLNSNNTLGNIDPQNITMESIL